ncbi:MAG TPA: hypothetical protein VIJ23_20930 [Mycobacterium sp.]
MLGAGLYLMGRPGVDFDLWFFWLGLAIYTFGVAFAATPATTWITRALPDAQQGGASAVNYTAREAGSAIGIAVLGSVLTSSYQSNVASAVQGLPPQLATQVEAGPAFTRATPPPGQETA